jgi:hypothetical protein
MCEDDKDSEGNFVMSSKNNDNEGGLDAEQKSSIGGLFLRNPRGRVSIIFLNIKINKFIQRQPNKTLRRECLIFSIRGC